MTEQTALPESIRRTFEQYGVIKRIAVPKLDLLDKAINDRKGRWDVSKNADGVAVASVTIQGQKFDGAADEANLALSVAFASALLGTQPRQGGLFDSAPSRDGGEEDDDDEPDRHSGTTITIEGAGHSVTMTSDQFKETTERLLSGRTRQDAAQMVQNVVTEQARQFLAGDIELDPDVTPHASGLIPDAVSPAIEVERTLVAAGIPVRYDADSGLYRNPNGDAYPERWAEQEAGIQARSMGFRTGSS